MNPKTSQPKLLSPTARKVLRGAATLTCCMFALLIWTKLRLVTGGVPRSAYAQPQAHVEPASEGAGSCGASVLVASAH